MNRWFTLLLLSGCAATIPLCAQDTINRAVLSPQDVEKARLEQVKIPLSPEIPQRPGPPVEWGDPLLGQGPIMEGHSLPSGAVLQPSVWVFGQLRSAVQSVHQGGDTQAQWVNRLDLLTNIKISGTDRLVAGVRPLDKEGAFSGRQLRSPGQEGPGEWLDGTNLDLGTLYYEGDLAEWFPNAGRGGLQPKHLGLVLGRQPLSVQGGMLINDTVDAVGLVRNNLPMKGTSNFRISGLFAWNQIHRHNHREDPDGWMTALFSEADFYQRTIAADVVYVHGGEGFGSGLFAALSQFRPVGRVNLTTRLAFSHALDDSSAEVDDGFLLFQEVNFTPGTGDDVVYVNSFVGVDQFTSAARAPATGGPLGPTGLLFASAGMGQYGAPLGNQAPDSYGSALGYQWFPRQGQQVVLEGAFRARHQGDAQPQWGVLCRFQQALTRRLYLQLDAFWADRDDLGQAHGGRMEMAVKL